MTIEDKLQAIYRSGVSAVIKFERTQVRVVFMTEDSNFNRKVFKDTKDAVDWLYDRVVDWISEEVCQ